MLCSFPGCTNVHHAKGLCSGHRMQLRRGRELSSLWPIRALVPNPQLRGTLLVPLTRGRFAIIDEADGAAVGRRNWHLHPGKTERTEYAATDVFRSDWRGVLLLHVFLWQEWRLPRVPLLDHKNNSGLDCRRLNLRPATQAENMSNRPMTQANTSGFKGVSWSKDKRKWEAKIRANGKCYTLGRFNDLAAAAAAYAAAAELLHGQFARTE